MLFLWVHIKIDTRQAGCLFYFSQLSEMSRVHLHRKICIVHKENRGYDDNHYSTHTNTHTTFTIRGAQLGNAGALERVG